jgi:predicted AAA+ superfamily ATPase
VIVRRTLEACLQAALLRSPVTALLGPRQCGKTTLALRQVRRQRVTTFDLEDPNTLAAFENPKATLSDLEGLVIIDEVQRRPDLFPVLRVLADRAHSKAKFLVLGSASPELLRQSSETLAGRIAFVEMGPFDLWEVGTKKERPLWWRGGFPRSFLSRTDDASQAWLEDFTRTFLERDVPQLGSAIPSLTLRRFWTMVAHYHGQVWNGAEVGSSLGISETSTRRYLDLLAGAYMIRLLPPWFENLGKRQRKAPKVYLRDSGLLHHLLGISSPRALLSHPKCGASWEGFAIEQVLRLLPTRDVYYWAVHGGSELDLFVLHRGRRLGFEIKRSDSPTLTRSMTIARDDLKLDQLWVVYPGDKCFSLGPRIRTLPLTMAKTLLSGE